MEYRYGMRLRGFGPGCQPKDGLLYGAEDPSGKYWNIIVYSRKLSEREMRDYDLDPVDAD